MPWIKQSAEVRDPEELQALHDVFMSHWGGVTDDLWDRVIMACDEKQYKLLVQWNEDIMEAFGFIDEMLEKAEESAGKEEDEVAEAPPVGGDENPDKPMAF